MKERTEIYDLYWRFAAERQQIFLRKLQGEPAPWTEDPILQKYKFCNAYRVNDRVSQYLIRNVIYNGQAYSPQDMIFRIVLFKLFNLPSTWELLLEHFGDVTLARFSFAAYAAVLGRARAEGRAIYNDAYIACASKAFGYDHKHENHLALLEQMFVQDDMAGEILQAKTMQQGFEILRRYPLIGDFMAYQLATDINYSDVVDWSEDEFTIVGPGSKRGIAKCFESLDQMTEAGVIKYMYNHQDQEFARLGLNFAKLGGRPLQLIDCQNLFCELDKYLRVYQPRLKSNRTKIKKLYCPTQKPLAYFYPPKWQLTP